MTVRLSEVSKSYGKKPVLCGVDAFFTSGKPVCVMGPSGCGKTTLLRILMGLEAAGGGRVEIPAGVTVAAVFQEDRLCENLSVFHNIALVRPGKPARSEVEAELEALDLRGSADLPASKLSGGMKRRAAIARALYSGADMLIFDEPFKGLDGGTRELVLAHILARAKGKILIVATHDARDAEAMNAVVLELPMLPADA